MADPIVIHVERPYATEDEFLDAEGWSITSRSMLLIGVEPLPEGTPLRCELRLSGGAPLILAEGIAVKHLAATATRPSGLVVRYKRMSAASSGFVQRAIERSGGTRPMSLPAAAPISNPMAAPSPTSAEPAKVLSSPPRRHTTTSPPPRNSSRPIADLPATRHPSERKSSLPPRNGSAHPDAVLPAKRGLSVRPSQAAPSSIGTKRNAPSLRNSGRPKSEQLAPDAAKRRDSSATQRCYDRDSAAMQRLRSRASNKAISSPPDREVVLSRLKKKPSR